MSTPLLSINISPEASASELLFAKQLGVDYVYTWVREHQQGVAYLTDLRERVEAAGLLLHNVLSHSVAKSDKIHLALPGREAKIAEFQDFVRNLGEAGIHTTTFTWEASGVWSSEPGETRGAPARHVDLDEMRSRPLTHGRVYSQDEIWTNYETFIKQIIPVAEEAGVRLALHPNDPPTPELGGIPSLIHRRQDYDRAFAIAGSPMLGMEFCTGCWLEGGQDFGDIKQAIRDFTAQDRILVVHFRNVSSALPRFTEAFLDNGYADMYTIMRTFYEAGYSGPITLDHTPQFAGESDKKIGTAYAIGYMRALMERAEAELGG